jgi:hypothetical protein
MELHADEPGMVEDLHHFHEISLGIAPSGYHASLGKALIVILVELIAVAVALVDEVDTIGLVDLGVVR